MTIEFVDELPYTQRGMYDRRGSVTAAKRTSKLSRFVRELSEQPGRWAIYPTDSAEYNAHYARKRYPQVQWARRTVDGKIVTFARWIGEA